MIVFRRLKKTELKIARTLELTSKHIEPSGDNDEDYLKDRTLIGESRRIGAGLDCLDIHLFLRIGNAWSIVSLIQNMWRWSHNLRAVHNDADVRNNCFDIVFSIKDCMHLFHRFYKLKYDE